MRKPRTILTGVFLWLVAAACAIAEPPTLQLRFVSHDGKDGSYKIEVDHVIRRIPSVKEVDQDHHIPGTLYKVEILSQGYVGKTANGPLKDVSKLQLIHEVTGWRIILVFGLNAEIEDPDGPAPRVKEP